MREYHYTNPVNARSILRNQVSTFVLRIHCIFSKFLNSLKLFPHLVIHVVYKLDGILHSHKKD